MNEAFIGRDSISLKVFTSVACLLFAVSAALQWNDPDPIRWFLLYASAAVILGSSLFVPILGSLFLSLATVAGVWAAILLPSVLSASSFTGTEEERELAGLALVALAGVVQWRSVTARRRAEADRPASSAPPDS